MLLNLPLNSEILGLILRRSREKKGCAVNLVKEERKSAATQHHLLLFQHQKSTSGQQLERGEARTPQEREVV